ncbi:MAG: hypothetical protein WBG08_12395 [Litorimonas sp.]
MRTLFKRLAVMAGCTAMFAGPAHANQYVELGIEGGDGPFAVCVGSLKTERVLGGFVTEMRNAAVTLPAHGRIVPREALTVIVTGSSGSVTVRPEPGTSQITVDMSRAERFGTECDADRAVNMKESTARFHDGLRRQVETMSWMDGKSKERAARLADPQTLMRAVELMESESLQAYREAGIERVIHGEVFEAVAEAQRKRKERERAEEFLKQLMAAVVARAEEIQREREADRRRKREEAEREWRRKEAEAVAEAEREEDSVKGEQCFGAVGQGCALLTSGVFAEERSSCLPGYRRNEVSCMVNTGSWAHDECCADHPEGIMCGGSQSDPVCQAEWDHAVAHTIGQVYSWRVVADPRVLDYDGEVDHDKYCAPEGATLAPREGAAHCCSRKVRKLHAWFFGTHYIADICRR